jgi:hypothetical protein
VPNNDAYDPNDPTSMPDYEDAAIEGPRTGIINHTVLSRTTTYGGKPTEVDGTTFRDADPEFLGPTESDPHTPTGFPDDGSLIGAVIEIIGGPGVGQSRYVTAVNGDTLTVDKAWAAGDVPDATSDYIIRRYDNLQLPSIDVRVEDNEAAGVMVYDEAGASQLTPAEPTVIEAGIGDSFSVVLTREPAAPVTVTLMPTDGLGLIGVAVSSTEAGAVNHPDGSLSLAFSPDNWYRSQTVRVNAVDDTLREGRHYGSVTFSVESADVDTYDTVTDALFDIAEDDPATSVILAHRPLTEALNPADPDFQALAVKIDGELRAAARYVLETSTIVFLDEEGHR